MSTAPWTKPARVARVYRCFRRKHTHRYKATPPSAGACLLLLARNRCCLDPDPAPAAARVSLTRCLESPKECGALRRGWRTFKPTVPVAAHHLCTKLGKPLQSCDSALVSCYQCGSVRKCLICMGLRALPQIRAIQARPVFMRVWRGPGEDINKVIHRNSE